MKLIILALLFIGHSAFGKLVPWDKNKKEEALRTYPLKIKNGFVSSMWGTINEPSVSLRKKDFLKGPTAIIKDWQGQSKRFESGFLKGRLLYWKDIKKNIKRPLYIIIPGSFSNLSTPQTKRYAHTIFKMGYNVIMLPNPLSLDYLKNIPKHFMGNVFEESEAISESIGSWLNSKDSKELNISSVNIVGTSYGGFVSSIIAGSKRNWPIALDKVFMISPPRYLMRSMLMVEKYVVNGIKYMSPYKTIELLKMISKTFMIYMAGPTRNFFEGETLKEIQSFVVIQGFQKLFLESIGYAQNTLGKKIYKKFEAIKDRDVYFSLKKELRFSTYVDDFLQITKKRLDAKEGDLLYWLDRPEAAHVKSRILTTKDDWTNENDVWSLTPDVFMLPRGGHFGFRGGLWLDRLIRAFF